MVCLISGIPMKLNFKIAYSQFFTFSDQIILSYNPLYAPLINVILILKSIFINEVLLNSLSPDQIKSKIYFNPELFVILWKIS
jgi:hypothetical protein